MGSDAWILVDYRNSQIDKQDYPSQEVFHKTKNKIYRITKI